MNRQQQDQNIWLKVGDTIWDYQGEPYVIVGETSRSWIVGPGWKPTKVPKKEDRTLGIHQQWFFDKQTCDDTIFLRRHVYAISKMVERLKDPAALREVARLVGWVPPEENTRPKGRSL